LQEGIASSGRDGCKRRCGSCVTRVGSRGRVVPGDVGSRGRVRTARDLLDVSRTCKEPRRSDRGGPKQKAKEDSADREVLIAVSAEEVRNEER